MLLTTNYDALNKELFNHRRRQRHLRLYRSFHGIKQQTQEEIEEQVQAVMVAARVLTMNIHNVPETLRIPMSANAARKFQKKLRSEPNMKNVLTKIRWTIQKDNIQLTMAKDTHERLTRLVKGHINKCLTGLCPNFQEVEDADDFDFDTTVGLEISPNHTFPLYPHTTVEEDQKAMTADICYSMPYLLTNEQRQPSFVVEIATTQQLTGSDARYTARKKGYPLVQKLRKVIHEGGDDVQAAIGFKFDCRQGGQLHSKEVHVVYYRRRVVDGKSVEAAGPGVRQISNKDGTLCDESIDGTRIALRDIFHIPTGYDASGYGRFPEGFDMEQDIVILDKEVMAWVNKITENKPHRAITGPFTPTILPVHYTPAEINEHARHDAEVDYALSEPLSDDSINGLPIIQNGSDTYTSDGSYKDSENGRNKRKVKSGEGKGRAAEGQGRAGEGNVGVDEGKAEVGEGGRQRNGRGRIRAGEGQREGVGAKHDARKHHSSSDADDEDELGNEHVEG